MLNAKPYLQYKINQESTKLVDEANRLAGNRILKIILSSFRFTLS